MSEHTPVEVRVVVKPDAFAKPFPAEIELFASILPELILLMQQHDEADD